jgi:hypothetical protein
MGAIDIHHHYVPGEVIGEAKRHGKALGIEVTEDQDGTYRFSFNSGPRYPLLQGLTDEKPRLAMMAKSKIALAALDPSTQLLGYHLKGEQAESWCRVYNEYVNGFLKKFPDRFTAMAAVPIQEPERAAKVLEHGSPSLDFAALISPPTSITVTTRAKTSIRFGPKRRSSTCSSSCTRTTRRVPSSWVPLGFV